jgi:hypothetical protein
MPDEVTSTLQRVAAGLPGGGETRPGQGEMADAVAASMTGRRHLVVQAGTGTGKSLAYLVPAALSGEKIVIATATKALQDQLADKDLPLVAAAVEHGLTFAVLKGRSNYVCRQRVSEIGGSGSQLTLTSGSADPPDADDTLTPDPEADTSDPSTIADQVRSLVRWAEDSTIGDRAELLISGRGPWSRPRHGSALVPSGARQDATASPRTPGPGLVKPTSSWSTLTCTAPTWPAGALCCPSTRWWCSTRPTMSKM